MEDDDPKIIGPTVANSPDSEAASLHTPVDISIPDERNFVETNRTRSKLFVRSKTLVNDQGEHSLFVCSSREFRHFLQGK